MLIEITVGYSVLMCKLYEHRMCKFIKTICHSTLSSFSHMHLVVRLRLCETTPPLSAICLLGMVLNEVQRQLLPLPFYSNVGIVCGMLFVMFLTLGCPWCSA